MESSRPVSELFNLNSLKDLDGNVLLNEMQIQSPPASLIAKCATALDDTVGE